NRRWPGLGKTVPDVPVVPFVLARVAALQTRYSARTRLGWLLDRLGIAPADRRALHFQYAGQFQRRDRRARLCQAEQPVFQTAPVDRTLDTAPGTCGQPVTEHDRGGDPGLRRAARPYPSHL